MTEWDMECGVEKTGQITKGTIYRDKELVHTLEWSNEDAWNEKERDWDWNFVYREFLEHIIKTRMYKRPKVTKRSKKTK